MFKGYAFWAMFIASMILGSLSFSVIVHIANTGDWDVLKHFNGNIFTSTVMFLPYFWLFSLGVFAMVAYFNCKHTRKAYRFRRRWILLGSVCLSVFLGSVFYAFGMGNQIDELMVKTMPFYDESKHKARKELWLRPEVGLIMGKVVSVDNLNKQMTIQDGEGKNWAVKDDCTVASTGEPIEKGKIVKIIGKKEGENEFVANEIRKCRDCRDDEDEDSDEADEDEKKGDLKIVKEEDNDRDEDESDESDYEKDDDDDDDDDED